MLFRLEQDWVVSPGETIKEVLEDIGMSRVDLATQIGLDINQLDQVIQGCAELTSDMANQLESALGISARIWNNLESNYRNSSTKRNSNGFKKG